jgi:hypothetical protein
MQISKLCAMPARDSMAYALQTQETMKTEKTIMHTVQGFGY